MLINHKPDIVDCLAHLSNDEIFTPSKVANAMLDLLPDEVWRDPEQRFLNPCTKSGMILREIARRLLDGLAEAIPDEAERKEHIFKRMIYGIAITELTAQISRRTLYCSKDASGQMAQDLIGTRFASPAGNIWFQPCEHEWHRDLCVSCGAAITMKRAGRESHAYPFLHKQLKEIFAVDFTVMVGNPPYQLKDEGHGASAKPIYQHFVSKGKEIADKLVMITPARWYAGGKGLDDYRAEMLADTKLAKLVDYPNAGKIFEGVSIAGGVSYFLRDKEHDGKGCEIIPEEDTSRAIRRPLNQFDILIRHNEAIPIVEKVLNIKTVKGWLSNRVKSTKPYNFRTNYRDFSDKSGNGKIAIHHRLGKGWIEEKRVLPEWNKGEFVKDRYKMIHYWKVFLSYANGAANQQDKNNMRHVIGQPFVASPPSCCTETFLVAGLFEDKSEAENYAAYLKTRFVRFLIGMRKNTQHNGQERFSFVPDLPMDRKWTDAALYKLAKLNADEIAFIESQIKEMP